MNDRRKSPTIDELQGRIIVLEALVMAAFGLAAKRPANFSSDLIIEMLNSVKSSIGGRLIREGVPQESIAEAQLFVDEVMSQFSENLLPRCGPLSSPNK